MIFKVFDGNEGISSKIGILNRSFSEITKAYERAKEATSKDNSQSFLKNFVDNLKIDVNEVGDLYKKFIVTQKDIEPFLKPIDVYDGFDDNKAADVLDKLGKVKKKVDEGSTTWQDFYNTLKPGEEWQANFVQTMDITKAKIDDVKEAQAAARQAAVNYNKDLGSLTIGAKATNIALKGLAMAGNILVSLAISKVISTVYEMAQASNTVGNAAREAADEFSNASSDIEVYRKKVEELYKTIHSSSSSIEDVTNARKQLLEVQDEMISKFGSEKEVIDLVTQAIDGQTKAFDELTLKKWQEAKNKFNDSTTAENLANIFNGYKDNIDRAQNEYFNFDKAKFDVGNIDQDLSGFKDAIKSIGADVDDTLITVNGNATEVYETLLKIQNLADDYNVDDELKAELSSLVKEAKDTSDKYKDFLDQYTLYEDILPDATYKKDYKKLTGIYSAYQKAYKSGDEESQTEAFQNYANALKTATADALKNGDEEVADYFKSMYPTIQKEVSSWTFQINFIPNKDGFKDTITQDLKTFTDKGYTTESFAAFDPSKSTDEKLNGAYNNLQTTLTQYNLSIEDLISTFEKLGLLVSTSKKQLLDKYSDKTDIIESMDHNDLDIAYKVDNKTIKTWDQLIEKIDEYKKAAAEAEEQKPLSKQGMISEINGLSEGFEELDKIMTSMKDKDKKFDYSLLDDKKFKDNFSNYTAEYEDFINAVTDSPKDVTACQDAFDKLTNAFIYNSKVIKGLSDDNADVAKQYLELMGVQNADEVVTVGLAQRHAEAAWEAQNLSNATYDEIVALSQETESTDASQRAFQLYLAKKILVNQTPYNASASIENLKAIVGSLGIATDAWTRYYAAVNRMQEIMDDPNYSSVDEDGQVVSKSTVLDQYGKIVKQYQEEAKKDIDAQFQAAQVSNYTGPKSTNPQKGSKGSQGAKDNSTIDWISRSADLLERESKRLETALQDTWTAYTGLEEGDAEHINELFASLDAPDTSVTDRLQEYADSLGMSMEELQSMAANTSGLNGYDIGYIKKLFSMDLKPNSEGMNELYEYAERLGMTMEQLKAASDSDNLPSQDDIDHINTLFSRMGEPNQDSLDELNQYANKLGLTLDELRNLAKDGGTTESLQSILTQKIDSDQKSLDQAEQSLDYYRKSYEEYVAKVPEYRDKIENGGDEIETFTSDQKAQVDKAKDAYDGMLDAQEKVTELQKTIRDEKSTYYDTIVDKATKENEKLATANDLIQKQIDLLNTQGAIVSADMYEEMIANTGDQIDTYQQILQARQDELADSMERGLKPGTKEWYELTAAVMEAKGNIKDLEKAQAEYEKQLRELPVTNLEKIGNIYQNILDTIQNWGAEMEASGKTLDAEYYQKLINNANTSISNYKEEIEAIQDVMEDYQPGTDNWNEMNDKLQQCNSSISSLVQNMHKWNEELLKLPIDKISDASDSLSKIVDGLNDVKSEHETVISAVTGAISDEIDRLNDEKEAYEDTINDQKEALQDRMDLLDKQNEKLKLQAQYEQALYDLENATTQKTEKVIRNGELTYESNADNLRNAQESVQDALAALKKQELQDQMDALDDALDDYNDKLEDTLDSLQKISDKWSEIASKKEQQVNENTATDILGNGWKDKVLSGNDADIFQMFSKLYSDNVDQINKYQEQIDSTEHISSLIQEYIDSYKAGTLTYEEAQAGIHDLVSQMNQKMSAMDNLQNIYNYMGKVYDTAADGNSVYAGIQKAFSESGNQLISSLEQYQANAGLISESMSSWQQLTNNVESIKDILEDVKDNLKDTERDRDDDKDDNVRGSGNSKATGKHSSKSVYGSSGFSVEKHHSGVFSGVVGSPSADKTNKIKVLEAEKLEPNEVPAILEHGEMVFTPEQMQKLAASFSATAYVPDNSWIKNMYPSTTVNTKPNVVNISVGDVNLTDVRDVDGFAKAMDRDFKGIMRQVAARY